MEALQAEEAHTGPRFELRTVEVHKVAFSILEKVAHRQSCASFALQHRVLPHLDETGLRLWPCSLRMIERLIQPAILPRMAEEAGRPLRVLELGAGTGLLGLAVSNALGSHVGAMVLSDPAMPIGGGWTTLEVLRGNVSANAIMAPTAVAGKLLWGDSGDIATMRESFGPFDVVIGSELLYREDSVVALAQTVQALGVPAVFLAQQTRPAGDMVIEDQFIGLMEQAGYNASRVSAGDPALVHEFRRTVTGESATAPAIMAAA